ncbi:MAG: hypothetical protein HFI20_10090 [Lachnospiraceae bacterium]|nr:hypothetical protein [Lachnospiraceae bacterium]
MPLEKGGRADKKGNQYEINCIIYEILKILDEINYSIVIEALGEDEIGTDILVTTFDGIKEHQQCKARNASKKSWEISDLRARNILSAWKIQLNRDDNRNVALISPMECSFLVDLNGRAHNTSGKAEDFRAVQIMKSSKEFQNFYKDFCTEMGLNYEKDVDIIKSIDYLRRINYKPMSEYTLRELIIQSIQFLFISEKDAVYNALVSLVVTKDILGKKITQSLLYDYFKIQKIELRLRDNDDRIVPRVNEINQEYRETFKPLQEGLIERKEFGRCIELIENEKSFIICGSAGYGKSGCTEAILNYCERKRMPYIAIKLDRRIPKANCERWGQELGLPSSAAYAIHCISKNEKAVIVLDQLDALRWTQANSSEAISICMELIRQVKYLNREREKKIIMAFVCRTYDFKNDNSINSLFKKEEAEDGDWEIVNVENLDEDTVKRIIGEGYDNLSFKLKLLLRIPSNIYIWQHLNKEESYSYCLTTSHLIEKWFHQICRKSITEGLQERTVIETTSVIVDKLDKIGRLYVPQNILNVGEAGIDYLISSEIIVKQKNKIGFAHQSILDYFICKRMMERYFEDENVENIIGEKRKQNPARRYQVQMFLQNILEYDSADFIRAGEAILLSDNIRYYVKFVFYEILGQILEPDENVIQFIIANCENEVYGKYLLNNVIYSKKQYIAILRNHDILDRWYQDIDRKENVFNLLQSLSPDLSMEDIVFIKKYIFKSEEDDKKFIKCFWRGITEESEDMFELRMLLYEHYPDLAQELFIDIKSVMEQCEMRAIKLISFWMKHKIKSQGKYVYRYEEQLFDAEDSFLIENGEFVFTELLSYIPKTDSVEVKYNEWSGKYRHKRGIERACVELVKKANVAVISKSPEKFWKYYELYMGNGYHVFNEIILHGLSYLPGYYSNRIIRYIGSHLDKNIFDYTSGEEDELGLVKNVLRVHGRQCEREQLLWMESVIYKYISPRAVRWYQRRIEWNKSKQSERVYWSFWGDLQYELLSCLPEERISKKSKDLLQVLSRRFHKVQSRYYNKDGHWGGVSSPVSGKNISKKQWLQIITNSKLKNRNRFKSIEVKGGFIESSLEMYVDDFRSAVRQEPQEMIGLVLEHKDKVLPVFIDSMFSGVELSESLKDIDPKTIERMFHIFPCDLKAHRATYFCGIIEKMNSTVWSAEVLNQLKEIALKHENPVLDKPNVTSLEDKEMKSCQMLSSNALNCVRGQAARAIGNLLWEDRNLFIQFREVIEKLVFDENPAVRFAALYVLWPSYNIEREWAEEKIIKVYESDIRTASFHDSKNMFFRLYSKYKERVLKIIEKCFNDLDKELIEVGGHAVCEFYIQYGKFDNIMFHVETLTEEQIKAILEMAIIYLDIGDYRECAKAIILKFVNCNLDLEFPLVRIFSKEYIKLDDDKKFLQEIVGSKASKKIVWSFTHYLEENALSILDYADIIIELCENILWMETEELRNQWGIEDEISKLIITLYDETANSRKETDRKTAEKCLELWDIMFERQLGSVREISRKLMER